MGAGAEALGSSSPNFSGTLAETTLEIEQSGNEPAPIKAGSGTHYLCFLICYVRHQATGATQSSILSL